MLALGLCSVASSCIPMGQKLLHLEISRGGVLLAELVYPVRDTSDVDAMWAAAGRRPFRCVLALDELRPVERPTSEEPLLARLEGVLQLSLMHTDYLESRVTLEGVCLERSDERAADWRLSAGDVARVRRAASR